MPLIEHTAHPVRSGSRALFAPAILLVCFGLGFILPQDAAASPESWRALGHEPSWTLSRSGSEMTLETDFGATRVSFPTPPATRMDDSTVSYATTVNGSQLQFTIKNEVCVDTMTGMPRPQSVSLTFGELQLKGCGGEPASLLQAHEWTVSKLAGQAVLEKPRITVNFDEGGRLSGLASCNRFGADYKLTGEGLQIGKGMSSMMACEDAVMKQEHLFLGLLEKVSRFSLSSDGALVLHTNDDRTIEMEKP
jgi:heat shock protein HslJ